MLLQSHQSFDTVAEYDPTTRTFTTFSRKAEPGRASSGQRSGVFDYLGERRVLLYRLAGVLYLEVDDQRIPMEGHVVEVHPVNGDRVLRVLANSTVVIELMYIPPHLDPPLSDDPTAFVEEEDFDFGLFLTNVSRDQERQARMYEP
jgi:hypothetical protein